MLQPDAPNPTPSELPAPDWGLIQAEDLAQIYRAMIGREVEAEVLAKLKPRPLFNVVREMATSEEVNRKVLLALVQQRPLPHLKLAEAVLAPLGAWLATRLGLPPAEEGEPLTWAHLLTRLYSQPALADKMLVAHGSLFTQALEDLVLLRKVGLRRFMGKIDFVNREYISGWATDVSGITDNVQIEIRAEGGLVVASGGAYSYRPDIAKHCGGNGMAGFRARWSPTQFHYGKPLLFTLHEASTGILLGNPYRFENNFFDQLAVSQRLAKEFEEIKLRLDHLAGMVPQALGYSAFPLEHYDLYRRTHHVPPPRWLASKGGALRHTSGHWGANSVQPVAHAGSDQAATWPSGFSYIVLIDAGADDPIAVRRTVDTLCEQTWPHWQALVIGDTRLIADVAALLGASDPRIHHAASWSAAREQLASLAADPLPWAVLLEAGDLADPMLLAWLVEGALRHPEAHALYWDEDRIEHLTGRAPHRLPQHVDPILRSPFCADSMLELNVVGTSFAVQANALAAAAQRLIEHPCATAVREMSPAESTEQVPGTDDGDPLCLAERERLIWALYTLPHGPGSPLRHIAQFLHSRTQPQALGQPQQQAPGAMQITAHQRMPITRLHQLVAQARPDALRPLMPTGWQGRTWRRVADPLWGGAPKPLARWQPQHPQSVISVLIPTRDHVDLVRQCVDSLVQLALHPQALEIIIGDNGSTEPETLTYLAEGAATGAFKVMRLDEPFNWSRLNNQMAQSAVGDNLLFLNNDTRMLTPEWDDALRGLLEREDVGAVGARLLYEDLTIQHAGVMFGYEEFVGHEAMYRAHDDSSAMLDTQLSRNVSAVTGAFLAMKKERFVEVGPFETQQLSVTFNDVEWCVRLAAAGHSSLYPPLIAMIHYESKSRGFDFTSAEKQNRAEYERSMVLKMADDAFEIDRHGSPKISGWHHAEPSLKH